MEEYIYIYIYLYLYLFIDSFIYIYTHSKLNLALASFFQILFLFFIESVVSLLIIFVREGRVLGKQWVWQITDGHLRE